MSQDADLKKIEADIADVKFSMGKIADALLKIAVLEEKHQTVTTIMAKILDRLELMEKRQVALEISQATQEAKQNTTIKAIQIAWTLLGGGIVFVVAKLIQTALN